MKLQIAIDDQRYEVEVEIAEDDTVPRPAYVPPVPPATRLGSAPQPAAPASDAHTCRSPIAGLVIRVNVQPGQTIQPNDLLLVLEAMKMETNVVAAAGGRIKAVTVNPGDAVQVNQVLVEFEKE
jgi:methylmalonyl-CoA carboxyltransferase small subunit